MECEQKIMQPQERNTEICTYMKKVATHLIMSINKEEDKAFLNIWGNAVGDTA